MPTVKKPRARTKKSPLAKYKNAPKSWYETFARLKQARASLDGCFIPSEYCEKSINEACVVLTDTIYAYAKAIQEYEREHNPGAP